MIRSAIPQFFLVCMIMAVASLDALATLSLKSSLSLPGIARDVAVKEPSPDAYEKRGIVFVSTDSGVAAVDASKPNAPVLKCFLRLPGKGNELSITGNLAFVTDGTVKGAQIVDISKPESLHVIGTMGDSCGYVWGIASKGPDNTGGSLAAIASLSGLSMFKVDAQAQATLKSRFNPYQRIKSPLDSLMGCDSCTGFNRWIKTDDVVLDSAFVYVLYYDYYIYAEPIQRLNLKKVDLSDPFYPHCIDSLNLHSYGCGLSVANGHAYVVYTGNLNLGFWPGMDIIDVRSSPMTIKSSMHLPGPGEDIVVSENLAYVACARNGIAVFNVSDPQHPTQIDSFPFVMYSFPITAYGIALSDTTIYSAMGERGLFIFKKPVIPVKCSSSPRKAEHAIIKTALHKGTMSIRFPKGFIGNVSIHLYTVTGAQVFKRPLAPVQNATVAIDRMNNQLQPGVYLLCVKKDAGANVFEKSFVLFR